MQTSFVIEQLDDLNKAVEQLLPLVLERKKVAFVGEIGAGKTTFIKLLCQRLGITETTSSPTFSIINEYKASKHLIRHVDLYRLKEVEEALDIGLLDLLEDEHFCFVEWPMLVEGYFPTETLWVKITAQLTGERVFELFYE